MRARRRKSGERLSGADKQAPPPSEKQRHDHRRTSSAPLGRFFDARKPNKTRVSLMQYPVYSKENKEHTGGKHHGCVYHRSSGFDDQFVCNPPPCESDDGTG